MHGQPSFNRVEEQAVIGLAADEYLFGLALLDLTSETERWGSLSCKRLKETTYNLGGTGINLCAPKFNLNFMKKSFIYMCAQLWNGLPLGVKLASNVNLFKNLL